MDNPFVMIGIAAGVALVVGFIAFRLGISYRKKIAERYGKKVAKQTLFAEAFQLSEYGSKLTKDNIDKLFPF